MELAQPHLVHHHVLVDTPHDHDVLCGRGGSTNKHPGNDWYRCHVNSFRELYERSEKHVKLSVAKRIVTMVHSRIPPGRFLQQDLSSRLWKEVTFKRAVKKASDALRLSYRDNEGDTERNVPPVSEPMESVPLCMGQVHNLPSGIPNDFTRKRDIQSQNWGLDIKSFNETQNLSFALRNPEKKKRTEEWHDSNNITVVRNAINAVVPHYQASVRTLTFNENAFMLKRNEGCQQVAVERVGIHSNTPATQLRPPSMYNTLTDNALGTNFFNSLGNPADQPPLAHHGICCPSLIERIVQSTQDGTDDVTPPVSEERLLQSLLPPSAMRIPSCLYECGSTFLALSTGIENVSVSDDGQLTNPGVSSLHLDAYQGIQLNDKANAPRNSETKIASNGNDGLLTNSSSLPLDTEKGIQLNDAANALQSSKTKSAPDGNDGLLTNPSSLSSDADQGIALNDAVNPLQRSEKKSTPDRNDGLQTNPGVSDLSLSTVIRIQLNDAANPLQSSDQQSTPDENDRQELESDLSEQIAAPTLTTVSSQLSDWWQAFSPPCLDNISTCLYECASTFFSSDKSDSTSSSAPDKMEMVSNRSVDVHIDGMLQLDAPPDAPSELIPQLLEMPGSGNCDLVPLFGRKSSRGLMCDDDDDSKD